MCVKCEEATEVKKYSILVCDKILILISLKMLTTSLKWASLLAQMVGNLPSMQKTQIQPLGLENPLEKGMATHPSILAWRIPLTEEPDAVQSMESQRV